MEQIGLHVIESLCEKRWIQTLTCLCLPESKDILKTESLAPNKVDSTQAEGLAENWIVNNSQLRLGHGSVNIYD